MGRRLLVVAGAAALAVLLGPRQGAAWGADAADPGEVLRLPGRAQDLAAIVRLSPETPRARVMLDVVRVTHGAPEGANPEQDRARAALRAWLSADAADDLGETEREVPSLLPPLVWMDILPGSPSAPGLAAAILLDRRAALLYHGLAGLDAASRRALAARPDLLRAIYHDHAAAFSQFGRSVHVDGGTVRLEAGHPSEWETLVGEKLGEPDAFVPKLLGHSGGRLAYCLDVLSHLRAGAAAFALEDPGWPGSPHGVRMFARACVAMSLAWDVRARPFSRPTLDVASLLRDLRIDAKGRFVGPAAKAFWNAVFETVPSGAPLARWSQAIEGVEPMDAPWLLERILGVPVSVGVERQRAVRFAQRLFTAAGSERDPDVARAVRLVLDAPALALVLERIGVQRAATYAAAAERVRDLARIGNPARARVAILVFQGACALVDGVARSGALSRERAVESLDVLLSIVPDADRGYAGAIAAWIDDRVLGALDMHPGQGSAGAERAVLSALAAVPRGPAEAPIVEWEGLAYRVDPAARALVRYEAVRVRQASVSFDAALAFGRAVRALESPRGAAGLDDRLRAVALAAEQAGDLPPVPGQGGKPKRVAEAVKTDIDALAGPRADRGDVRRARHALEDLGEVLLADTLGGIAYAVLLGEAEGAVSLAPDIARRHDFSADERVRGDLRGAWRLPRETVGGGVAWHVRGALVALDFALAPLALSLRATDQMPSDPRLSGNDRRAFAHTLSLMIPSRLGTDARDALASALVAGRTRLQALRGDDGDALARAGRDAGWSEWQRTAVAWSFARDPDAVAGLVTLTDLFWLGAPDGFDPRQLDAWGAVTAAEGGPLSTVWPPPEPWEHYAGRPASGELGAHSVEVTLRIVQAIAAHGLPAALVPALLAPALADVAYQAPLGFQDDWPGLARYASGWSESRLEDFIAALTAAGPLEPAGGDDPFADGGRQR